MGVSGFFLILRRLTGAVGSVPLKSGQFFSNQVDDTVYLGYGDDGTGNATSQKAVGGAGAFVDKTTAQTIAGVKTFSSTPQHPTATAGDSSTNSANTAFVSGAIATAVAPLVDKSTAQTIGGVKTFSSSPAVPTPAAGDNSNAAASTQFVQGALSAVVQGVRAKPTARMATTGPLAANTYSNGVLTASANGVFAAIDGLTPAANDYVLVKDETTQANRGLYTVTSIGSASTPYVLTRAPEMDNASEFNGALVTVGAGGATWANSFWLCTSPAGMTLGTTAVGFQQINGATDLSPVGVVNINGNAISIKGVSTLVQGDMLKFDLANNQFVKAVAGTDYVAPGSTLDSGTA